MPEPINFLGQLTQSGALNVRNPMESYQNALKLKALQEDIQTAPLKRKLLGSQLRESDISSQAKLFDMARITARNIETVADLQGFIKHYENLGVPAEAFGNLDKIKTDEDAQEIGRNISLAANDFYKLSTGGTATFHNTETGESYEDKPADWYENLPDSFKLKNGKPIIVPEGSLAYDKAKKKFETEGTEEGKGKEDKLPKNAFEAFSLGMKEDNPLVTAKEISDAWQAQEEKKIKERYPTKQAVTTIPGLTFDRRSGEYKMGKLPQGLDTGNLASVKADVSALNKITTREQLIDTFVRRIDANIPVVENLAEKVKNIDPRFLNRPINSIKQQLGSGELQALKLALKSLSNEVAKVESGSLGIAEVSVGQAEAMGKIHDPNLSLADLKLVLETSRVLGETSMRAIGEQRIELISRIQNTMNPDIEDTTEQIDDDAIMSVWRKP